MDRCADCGFEYAEHGPPRVVDELRTAGTRFTEQLGEAAADHDTTTHLSRRPDENTWSVIEYAAHLRDVLLVQRERVLQALVEDTPAFVPMYRERRVSLAGYQNTSPERLIGQLDVAMELFVDVADGLGTLQWSRTCIYNYPTPTEVDLAWVAVHTLHECVHHLGDVETVLTRTAHTR